MRTLLLMMSLLAISGTAFAAYEEFIDPDNDSIATAQYVGGLYDGAGDLHVFGVRGTVSVFGTTINDNSKADFYSFDIDAGTRIRASVLTPEGPQILNDPILGLFDSAGNMLAFNDDGYSVGVDSQLTYTVGATDFYYLAVSGFGDSDFSGEDGSTDYLYTLNVSVAPVPLPGAAWLLSSALLGFAGFATRGRRG